MSEIVAILGASDKPERYSHKAMKLLEHYGHKPLLVHPNLKEIEGHKVYSSLTELSKDFPQVDTLTVYISPMLSNKIIDEIANFKTKRVIFNPGTENDALEAALAKKGVEFERACTLVLLNTDQF